jgi:hypothetical protein
MNYQNTHLEEKRLETIPTDTKESGAGCLISQFFIFKKDIHIGWDCFYKEKISIGSSEKADLVLKGNDISAIHAVVYLKNNQIVVMSQNREGKVLVNNQSAEMAILGKFDYLDIGPYTIKIKILESTHPVSDKQNILKKRKNIVLPKRSEMMSITAKSDIETIHPAVEETKTNENRQHDKHPANQKDNTRKNDYPIPNSHSKDDSKKERTSRSMADRQHSAKSDPLETEIFDSIQRDSSERFRVVFQGEVSRHFTTQEVNENVKHLSNREGIEFNWIDSVTPVVVQKELTHQDALKLCCLIEKTGAKVNIEKMEENEKDTIQIPENKLDIGQEKSENRRLHAPDTDEDEDEDDDREALFGLKEMILNDGRNMKASADSREINVEVTKFKNSTMVDIFFLKPKNQYHIRSRERKFLLAEHSEKGTCFFYFSDHVWGTILKNGSDAVKTDHLKKTARLQNENEGIYQYPIQIGDTVTVTDGIFDYIIRSIFVEESPEINLPEQEEKVFHKYMIKSSIFHMFLLVFLGFFNSVKQPEPLPPETHFVKIDTSELSKIITMKRPVEKPVVKPKIMEPMVEKKQIVMESKKKAPEVVENKKIISKAMENRKQMSQPGTGNSKKSGNQVVSRSPQAGGGFGQGNISNRNINQQGLLSMLGNSVGIQPQAAMAAVTNLDAVSSVHSGNANFKVGGIAGNLGNAKIEIPKISNTGIVGTKGSSQVLRSYGAEGKGTVAALEKGKIGQKQVQGMVSAQLSAQLRMAVGVSGGMSREAVKKVIDQHLDEISYCYETALISNPSIMGKVIFEWKILTSGKVGMVQIKSSTINSNEIHSCIKAAIQTWQFPQPKGSEVIVSYPFVFDIVGF